MDKRYSKSIIVQTPTNQDRELTTKDAEIKMVKKQKVNVFIGMLHTILIVLDELRIFGNTDSLTLTTSVIEELLE